MNFADPKLWLDALQWLVMIVLAIVAYTRRPGEEASSTLSTITVRLAHIDEKLSAFPSRQEITQLQMQVAAFNERMDAQDSVIVTLQKEHARRLERMEDFFLLNFRGNDNK
jgi:hypothetical protein